MKNTNLKFNKTKLVARLMLVVILFSTITITGCSLIVQQTTEENKHHEPEDLVNGMLAKMQAAGYEKMEETAELYYQCTFIDYAYNYPVEIIEGELYLWGHVFDIVSYVNDYSATYEDSILKFLEDVEKYEMLVKIQNHSGCYILMPQDENVIGTKVIVYEIDGVYYFLACYYNNDTVLRIHKLVIQ